MFSHATGRWIAAAGSRNSVAKAGTRLEIWDCVGGSWLKVDLRSEDTARMYGLCMEIAHGSQDDGAVVQLAKCNGSWYQQFHINSSNDLVNTRIGESVDVRDNGTSNSTMLQLWTCTGADNQKWSEA